MAMSRNLSSSLGLRTIPWSASRGFDCNLFNVLIGCLHASNKENRDVSLTREGFPIRASMYRAVTPVAPLAV